MAQNQALPAPNLPLLGNNGQMNPIWYQFFNSLWQRTGGGSNSGNVQSITVLWVLSLIPRELRILHFL
jgi:hypothetical protein